MEFSKIIEVQSGISTKTVEIHFNGTRLNVECPETGEPVDISIEEAEKAVGKTLYRCLWESVGLQHTDSGSLFSVNPEDEQ